MCGEEECVCELDGGGGVYGCCYAVEDAVVRASDDLDGEGGGFGGSGGFDFFARDGWRGDFGGFGLGSLSFGHFGWLCVVYVFGEVKKKDFEVK